jgi:hypothetical protein
VIYILRVFFPLVKIFWLAWEKTNLIIVVSNEGSKKLPQTLKGGKNEKL